MPSGRCQAPVADDDADDDVYRARRRPTL